jgi:tRNA nucleotidyltransferase/poly(A) polymerase
MLLGIGGYGVSSQKEVTPEVVAVTPKPVIISKKQLPTIVENTIPQVVAVEKSIPQKSTLKTSKKIDVVENKQLAQLPPQQFIKVEEPKQIAQSTIPEIKKLASEPNTIILVLENQQSKVEEETIVLNMVEIKPEVVVQTDLNDSNIKKETRLSKIWQQLKRAKNGENVNWSEVGIKPQKMLARADAKIENVLTKGENNEQ